MGTGGYHVGRSANGQQQGLLTAAAVLALASCGGYGGGSSVDSGNPDGSGKYAQHGG